MRDVKAKELIGKEFDRPKEIVCGDSTGVCLLKVIKIVESENEFVTFHTIDSNEVKIFAHDYVAIEE
jgi:hypothetical protein